MSRRIRPFVARVANSNSVISEIARPSAFLRASSIAALAFLELVDLYDVLGELFVDEVAPAARHPLLEQDGTTGDDQEREVTRGGIAVLA